MRPTDDRRGFQPPGGRGPSEADWNPAFDDAGHDDLGSGTGKGAIMTATKPLNPAQREYVAHLKTSQKS